MAITTVALSNTFNEFRITSNQVINRLNEFESAIAVANVNTLSANTVDTLVALRSNTHTTFGEFDLVINTNSSANTGNTASITVGNGISANLVISTPADGMFVANTSTSRFGVANTNVLLTTYGTGDLVLSTNSSLNSGTITIFDGVNGNVDIAPNGTGDVYLTADTVRIGDNNVDAVLTTYGTGNITISTNSGTNSGTIAINQGLNGNIEIAPNGTGDLYLTTDSIRVGDVNVDATITTNGTGDLILNTNSGGNSGVIRVYDGINGNIDLTPNGTGSVTLTKLSASGVITSTVAFGTAPFTVTSNTVVTNLNVDKVDGKDFGTFTAAGGILYATATTSASATAAGTSGQAILSGGAGAPTFQTIASSNGASTIVARDVNGSFIANAITTTSISGNGSALTALNGSNVSSGTIANARTTAASANGASTIVTRDVDGSFSANSVTVVSLTFTSALAGDGSGLYSLNGSNVSSGTIANARTTAASANGASTIVTRDVNGDFSSRNITATLFAGSGASLTALNGSNVSSGTIANARTTAASANGASTIVARDANGSFTANIVTAIYVGDGSALTSLNGSNVSSGTIANARTTAASSNGASTIVARDVNGDFTSRNITATLFAGSGASLTSIPNSATTAASANGASTIVARDVNGSFVANAITTTSISGNGSGLTALDGGSISTGTIANARTTAASANGASTIVARDVNGDFTSRNINATLFVGSGASLTSIPLSAIGASSANGASTVVARDVNGSFTTNIVTATHVGDGSALTTLNGSNVSTGTIANARTTAASANGASTIVARDANGDFTTRNINATLFAGSGASLTSIPNSATTAASANGASTIVARDANGDFTARNINATLFAGSGASLTSIPNSATTAASANGASTIASRDANGNIFANTIFASVTGNISGVATSATKLETARTINGVSFDGTANVTITANTTQTLTIGTYLTGSNFNGGTATTWAVNASSANGASTVVARDVNGSFTANVVTATSFSGSGASLTTLNGTQVTTGTVANARTTAASANGASTIVTRDVNGDFTARTITASSFSGSLDWSNVANKPDPVVTVTLTGDVTGTGSATLTDLANGTISFATTIAADSVILGTDTTGNYVATVAAGTSGAQSGTSGLTISATAGEGTAATIAHADTSTLTGQQGTAGIANFTIDGLGHITAATTATYLTAEADTLSTVTGRGATTSTAITLTNATASTSTSTGALIVTGGVGIGGALNALSKSFIIKHPTKAGMLLRYGSLEGPELGVYARGRCKSGVIALPEYWTNLVHEDSITVELTCIGRHQQIYVEKIENNAVYIGNESDGMIDCFYKVYGERKDIDKLVVEYQE